jgi:ectoine hydroxylase-related dioxygenase (phytanoyl-CoA dioxygenase family)
LLSREQQEQFFERGYVVQEAVFAPREVRRMRGAFERLRRMATELRESGMHRGSQFVLSPGSSGPGAKDVRIHRIVWCGAAEPTLSEFGRDPRLVGMASRLLGSHEMQQLINQAHYKIPGDGVEFPWHQDSTHRRYGGREWRDANGRGSYVQTVTAIDDMTALNGPMEFLPGSCSLGHVEPRSGEEGRLPAGCDPNRAVRLSLSAGGVVLFGPYVFHRSRANRSRRSRRVFINGFAYPGANRRVYPGHGAGRILRAEERTGSVA